MLRCRFVALSVVIWTTMMGCAGAETPGSPADAAAISDAKRSDAGDTAVSDSMGGDAQMSDGNGASHDGVSGHKFKIDLDYSLDAPGFFDDPKRRKTLEAAAQTWANMIQDDFETVPAGTTVKVRNPSKPLEPSLKFKLKEPIDDLRIYVSCSTDNISLGKAFISVVWSTSTDLGKKLKERYKGDKYEPWVMAIAFNCDKPWYFDQTPETVDDLPKDRNDFLSTARHEIGHCLGLLNADVAKGKIQTIDDAPYFTGEHAVKVYGGPVPLEPDGRHLKNGLLSGGTEARMDPSTKKGTRKWPTPVDIALLKDIGYKIQVP